MLSFQTGGLAEGGPVAKPPSSFRIRPHVIFFSEHVKNIIYSQKVGNLAHLWKKIIRVVSTVTKEMLHNLCAEIDTGLDNCRATNGRHVQVYYSYVCAVSFMSGMQ